MTREEIKQDTWVIDRWFPHWGSGIITKVKKTVFTVIFNGEEIKYDYPHARYLEKTSS
jgi:hypothetical protein